MGEHAQTPPAGNDTGLILRGLGALTRSAEVLAATSIGAIVVLVVYEVISRYVFNAPTLWTQDLCIYLLVWAAFLGLAPAERAGEHIRIDLAINRLKPPQRRRLEIATCLAVAGFAALAAWKGLEVALQSFNFGRRSVSLFSVPMWMPQVAVPVGAGLLALEALRRAWWAWRIGDGAAAGPRDGGGAST